MNGQKLPRVRGAPDARQQYRRTMTERSDREGQSRSWRGGFSECFVILAVVGLPTFGVWQAHGAAAGIGTFLAITAFWGAIWLYGQRARNSGTIKPRVVSDDEHPWDGWSP